MIIAKTKLKVIPKTCGKCRFYAWHEGDSEKTCSFTGRTAKRVFVESKNNWCGTRDPKCPLVDIGTFIGDMLK